MDLPSPLAAVVHVQRPSIQWSSAPVPQEVVEQSAGAEQDSAYTTFTWMNTYTIYLDEMLLQFTVITNDRDEYPNAFWFCSSVIDSSKEKYFFRFIFFFYQLVSKYCVLKFFFWWIEFTRNLYCVQSLSIFKTTYAMEMVL